MLINPKNIRLGLLIFWFWILSFLRVTFSNAAHYIDKVSIENADEQSLVPEDWSVIKKIVKGVRRISPLFLKRRKCLMEALIVFRTLKKTGIHSHIRFGANTTQNLLKTHAWVTIGETTIMGGPISEYQELIRTR